MRQSINLLRLRYSFVLLLMVGLAACHSSRNKQQEETPQYNSVVIKQGDATVYTSYATQLESENVVTIYSRATGYIERLYVAEGDHVRKGQTILKIQDNDYQQALRSAKAAYDNASLEVQKVTPLVQQGIISSYQLETDKSNLEAAKATYENAKINLGYTLITSPVTGVVGQITLREGSLVTAGAATPITTVSASGNMFAYFSFDEKKLLSLADTLKGTLQQKVAHLPAAELVLADGSVYPLKGKIALGSGMVDPTTGTLLLKAVFPNPKELLRTGSTGTVRLPTYYQHVLLVPQKATFDIQDKKMVYTVGDHNIVHAANITVEAVAGDNYVVTDGVKEGDIVIVDGINQIKEGMEVVPFIH